MFDTLGLLFGAILSFFRTCQSLLLETLALRLQLTVLKLHPTSKIFITELASELKIRVPDTFQLGAILPFFAFLASRKINKLRVFNTSEYSDSPRLQSLNCCVINGLHRILASLLHSCSTRTTPHYSLKIRRASDQRAAPSCLFIDQRLCLLGTRQQQALMCPAHRIEEGDAYLRKMLVQGAYVAVQSNSPIRLRLSPGGS
jgi:hypothetical protein